MFAVIRIRGNAKVPGKIEQTLQIMGLKKLYNCTVIPEEKTYKGMLQKAKGYITWGEVNKKTLKKLLEKEELNEAKEIKTIRLHPPKGGFKGSKKRNYHKKGEQGYRGKEINKLIQKMM